MYIQNVLSKCSDPIWHGICNNLYMIAMYLKKNADDKQCYSYIVILHIYILLYSYIVLKIFTHYVIIIYNVH